jgi:hypothetical protein
MGLDLNGVSRSLRRVKCDHLSISVQRGVSKGVEDGRRPPALRANPETDMKLFQGRLAHRA